MSVGERDPHTGIHTTGHEWSGIKELDTPIPRIVFACYAVVFIVALVMWVLLPAWPLVNSYTSGLMGFSQRDYVRGQLADADLRRAEWSDRIAAMDFGELAADPEARTVAIETGESLFIDNCAVCHGRDGRGGPGFPDLTDGAWLWGGTPEDIHETLRVGINSGHDETRFGQMPAFGRDEMLERDEIRLLATYVQHLSGLEEADGDTVAQGEVLFADNCASCHGEDARGGIEFGAPDLTDGYWIYGGDRETIYESLFRGRQGHMPHWSGRLSPVQLRVLSLYVDSLNQ
ncbi:MAG: cytochrome-c oxidase, cbb3-type subunit III [Alphaproteobacteria bacterium]|nr:cytochrome-c oxidase, cbb3-type subunit III [Alphaproteobacteria bacterium]